MVEKRLVDAIDNDDIKTKRWKTNFTVGRMAYEEGALKEARHQLARCLNKAKDVPHKVFAESATLMGLGAVCVAAQDYKNAAKYLDKAMRISRGNPDRPVQEVYAISLRFYADMYAEQEEFSRAESLLEESIQVLEELGVDAALPLADSICDLCGILVIQGKDKQVEEYIESAMSVYRTVKGVEDIDYYRAMTIHKIASHETKEEDIEELLEETITKAAYQVSLKHPHLVRFLRRYCKFLKEKGELDKVKLIEDHLKKLK